MIHYSFQSRVDFLLQSHLPPLARGLADAVNAPLRNAYTVAHGKNLPDPEGEFFEQQVRSGQELPPPK